jgi:hypothetical protein
LRLLAATVAALLVATCSVFRATTPVVDGWQFPTPAPLPPGATEVTLETSGLPASIPFGAAFGCQLALLSPFTITYVREDAVRPVRYRAVEGGADLHIKWQFGVSARFTDHLEIVGPDGTVLAREGAPVEGLGGGAGNDGAINICIEQYLPKRVGQ